MNYRILNLWSGIFCEPAGEIVTEMVLSPSLYSYLPLNIVDSPWDVGDHWQDCVQSRGVRFEPAIIDRVNASGYAWCMSSTATGMVLETPLRHCTGHAYLSLFVGISQKWPKTTFYFSWEIQILIQLILQVFQKWSKTFVDFT